MSSKDLTASAPKPRQSLGNSDIANRNELMRRDRMMGDPIRLIAKNYGLHVWNTHRIVAGVTIHFRRSKKPAKPKKETGRAERMGKLRSQAMDLRKRGYSYRQIAAMTGISRATAHTCARVVKVAALEGNARLPREERQRLKAIR